MATFYDEWLAAAGQIQEEFRCSPMISRDSEIPWVSTPQDTQVKLMVSNTLGFPTMGSEVAKAEIPVGWHTGMHAHGEESIYIVSGEGFSVIDSQRFDWHSGSTIQVPYRAAHQHFNTGSEPALYVSVTCFSLERFLRLASIEQREECGPNDSTPLATRPPVDSQYLERDGRRVVIHIEDAPNDPGDMATGKLEANINQHYSTRYLALPRNGFREASVAVAHLFEEPPGYHGGRHRHLEAMLYVLEGEGLSEVGGVEQQWGAGDILHVPPAMFEHEHYNSTNTTCRMIRMQSGIRFWFTSIWPEGYTSQRVYDTEGRPIIGGMTQPGPHRR